MASQDPKRRIVDYLKKNLKKGYPIDSLRWALVNQGYSRIMIEDAIRKTTLELAKKAPVLKDKPIIRHEILDEHDQPVEVKKSFLDRLFKK